MTEQTERERLIEELTGRPFWLGKYKGLNKEVLSQAEVVADFILADRKRIENNWKRKLRTRL